MRIQPTGGLGRHRSAPIVLVGAIALFVAACGSAAPAASTPATTTATTTNPAAQRD